jgi:hypothetical protein
MSGEMVTLELTGNPGVTSLTIPQGASVSFTLSFTADVEEGPYSLDLERVGVSGIHSFYPALPGVDYEFAHAPTSRGTWTYRAHLTYVSDESLVELFSDTIDVVAWAASATADAGLEAREATAGVETRTADASLEARTATAGVENRTADAELPSRDLTAGAEG